jgi:hypothetical protein
MRFKRRPVYQGTTAPSRTASGADSNPPPPPPPDDAPGDPSAGAPPPRRWRRFFLRTSVRLTAVALLVLLGLGVFAYAYPLSNRWIDARLKSQWNRATGLQLEYDKATFLLSRGFFKVERPVIVDPDDGRPLLATGGLTLQMPLGQFLLGRPPYVIDSIDLDGPLDLTLRLRDGRWHADEGWGRIVEAVRRHHRHLPGRSSPAGSRPLAASTNRLGIRHVNLQPLNLVIIDDHSGSGQDLLRLEDASFHAYFDGTLYPRQILLSGRLNGRRRADSFWLTLRPDIDDGRVALTMVIPELASRLDFPWPAATDWRIDRLELQGAVQRGDDGRWSLEGHAVVDRCAMNQPDPLPPLDLGRVDLGLSLRADLVERRLDLSDLQFRSDFCAMRVAGRMLARYPFDYAVTVEPFELTGGSLEMLALQWPPLRGVRDSGAASLKITGSAAGDMKRIAPRTLTGAVLLQGVDWSAPFLPAPLRGLKLDARLTSASLNVERLAGVLDDIPVELKGRIVGDIMNGRIDRAELDWTTVGSVERLMELIERAPAPEGVLPRLAGRFTGEGRLSVHDPLHGDWRAVLGRTLLEGRLMFHRGAIAHPALPDALTELNGELDFTREEVVARHLTGRMFDADFTIDGRLSGNPAFWIRPRARLLMSAAGDVERVLPRVCEAFPRLRVPADRMTTPTGRLDLKLNLSTDFRTLDATQYSGSLNLRDAASTLDLPRLSGPLHVDRVAVAFSTETLHVGQLTGTLGGLALQGDARLTPAEGSLDLKLDGALTELQARLPGLLDWFHVGGQIAVDHRVLLERRSTAADFRRWAELVPLFRRGVDRMADPLAAFDDLARMQYTGRIQLRDAEMTFLSMPTRLAGLNGEVRYDRDHVWTPRPMATEGGEGGRDLNVDLEFTFPRPGHPPVLRFDGQGEHFPLDRWATTWRHPGEASVESADDADAGQSGAPDANAWSPPWPRDYVLDASKPPEMIVDGRIRSRSVSFHRLRGADFDGHMRMEMYRGQPHSIAWDNVRSTLYGGRLSVSGRGFNWRMTNDLEVENVDLAELAKALAGRDNVQGIFSGLLTGKVGLHTGFGHFYEPTSGLGELSIAKSRFVSNTVLGSVGGVSELPIFDDVSFSRIHGPFTVAYPTYATDGIVFENPLMNLNLDGVVGPDGKLDLDLKLQFLRIVEGVPLVGNMLDLFNKLAGTLLRFHIQGTVDHPRVTPL